MPHTRGGFTLVELAIVLVVIGLIAGGILVGRHLVNAALVQRTIGDLNQLTIEARLFEERYRALPGDLPAAASVFDAHVLEGDGDKMIWWPGEMFAVWMHLSLAGLSPNFTPVIWNGGGLRPETREVWPPARLDRGYYWLGAIPNSAYDDQDMIRSTYFMIATTNDEALGVSDPWQGVMSAGIAYAIDVKLDDGLPNRGKVRASGGYLVPGSHCLRSGLDRVNYVDPVGNPVEDAYDLVASEGPECRVYFLPFE